MIPVTSVKVPVALPIRRTANKHNIYLYFMYTHKIYTYIVM